MSSGQSLRKLLFVLVSVAVGVGLAACGGRNHRRSGRTPVRMTQNEGTRGSSRGGSTTIPLVHEDGVYYMTVKVNDVPMKFIFDTGASTISMSQVEAEFLIKQGTLTKDDVLGSAYYSDANGDVTEGILVNLRKVQIGDHIVRDVQASIVPNQVAPLLLGQTVLKELGTITMDYKHNRLIIK